jgi:SAM-dependent methyltransferase
MYGYRQEDQIGAWQFERVIVALPFPNKSISDRQGGRRANNRSIFLIYLFPQLKQRNEVNIGELSDNLTKNPEGIWQAPSNEAVSYPEDNHDILNSCEENSFWFRHRLDCISLLIRDYNITSLLDVGGGNGRLTALLQDRGVTCALLEPGPHAIRNAQAGGVRILINSALTEAKFKDGSFPAVGMFDVLEHIEDDGACLKEVNRILKPGGRLILTVPAFMFLFSDFDREAGHFRRYTLSTLTARLRENGFAIDYKTYLFMMLTVPMFLLRRFRTIPKGEAMPTWKNDHVKESKFWKWILGLVLGPEKKFLRWKWIIPFGSSCLVVARKET